MGNSGKVEPVETSSSEDASDELSHYDLLSSDSNGSGSSGSNSSLAQIPTAELGATARAFNRSIQQKKKAQEEAVGQAEKATRHRHAMMIDALMHVRRSMREVTKIDLGERFHLTLASDDVMGWPRLTLKLHDKDLPDQEYSQFSVSAHDRNATGTIEIVSEAAGILERIMLAREMDAKRLPRTLKKCVRNYLDLVGEVILRSEREQDLDHADSYMEKRKASEFEEASEPEPEPEDGISGDLFDEHFSDNELLDVLPSLDELKSLPDLAMPKK